MLHALPSEAQNVVVAGPFGEWLAQARAALRGNGGMNVPCGSCTGCCTSGYSVQLRPEDQRAATLIPAHRLVSPPGFPHGHLTMRALPNGLCPMLEAGRCTIYAERPQTCLDYDCRIFAAAGIDAGGTDKVVINQRVRAWRFSYPTEADNLAHSAVLRAAEFIQHRRASFPDRTPTAAMGIAVLAIKVYAVFLDPRIQTMGDTEIAYAIMSMSREFDAS
jgi:hypothetical protein